MLTQLEKDKKYLLGFMEKNCCGYQNARTKQNILPYLLGKWNERYFREIISELKKENHVASTSSRGYWFIPLQTQDRNEILAEIESAEEMKSRALDMLEGADKKIKSCRDRIASITIQPELVF